MNSTLTQKDDCISKFGKAYQRGVMGLMEAAEIYVKAIEENPGYREKFHIAYPYIPISGWQKYEMLGKKMIHPRLLMGGGGKITNYLEKIPYSEQEKIFSGEKIEYLTLNGDVLKVDILTADKEIVRQVIGKDHIRSISEQKAWFEYAKSKKGSEIIESRLPYEIRKDGIFFNKGTLLKKKEAIKLLAQLIG